MSISAAQPDRIVFSGNDNKQIRKGQAVTTSEKQSAAKVLSRKQFSLSRALLTSQEIVVPASIEVRIDWQDIDNHKKDTRKFSRDVPTSLEIICWAIGRAMNEFDKFRCQMSRSGEFLQHEAAFLGIARRGEGDELDISVISLKQEDTFPDMARALKAGGNAPPPEFTPYHSLVISDMSSLGVFSGQPVVVHPAIATLFIGAPCWALTKPGKYTRLP